ncbi:MAG: rRNA maturation RNase YbeY [Chloroflexi bacterium]|nr:MAG: rRNA maturation RNase YbeY [Chloroflexota bacterium]
MNIFVDVAPEFTDMVDTRRVEQAIQTTVQHVAPEKTTAGVSLSVATSETVQELNRQYRGVNAPTDVLSFGNESDPDFPDVEPDSAGYLGDIIIAGPVAAAQAAAAGHSTAEEILLLSVHGTLHLLGFDHNSDAAKARMWAAQQQVMDVLNLSHVQPTEA